MTVHLFVRSSFTLLSSTIRINALTARAKELGYSSIALTDHNVMHGAAAFSHACEKDGIHPIYGLEADCLYHEATVPFLLLAKDNIGYSNLMRLSSLICGEARQCTPEQLTQYAGHCFLIAYGEGGWFDSELIADQREEVRRKLEIMKQELPAFDVALSYNDASLWKMKNAALKRICATLGIRTVALNKIYYLKESDAEAYRAVCAIRQNRLIADQNLPRVSGRSLLSPAEMQTLYEPDDLARTDEIAAGCQADLKLPKTSLPAFPTPAPLTSAQYLTQLCLAGLSKRRKGRPEENYLSRLKYELDVIIRMHFEDYFLIVYDFIRAARNEGIYMGPGRGSAAGSLVAYSLGITQVDPIRYSLLFERFLNPERVSMPDIDTDIPDNRRQEVIGYVCRTYGLDHVAGIVTFGTLGAKQVIHDVGKAMNLNSRDVDMLTRMIPNTPKITLQDAMRQNARLRQVVNAEVRYQKLFAMAQQLEGLPRNTSIHAGGVIMSRLSLQEVVPTMDLETETGMRTSQFTMEYLEERGLIKMDFLGLRNLSIIDEIVHKIQAVHPEFRIMSIPLDDRRTYEVFQRVDTVGIFQFESSGMKNLLRRMKPDRFEDIVAALALFRPGPMENIPTYIANKADPSKIRYPARELEPVLKETYGVMIYQEQVMMTARIAAGFSLARADVLRRAISKKKAKELEGLKEEFLKGCRRNGYTEETAAALFGVIEKFAGYGFNKSHAVAYGLVAYQLAFLKANAPLDFYSSLLDSVVGDDEKTSQYIDECRRRGINVLYPDVCSSKDNYAMEDNAIRLPLCAVKGIGREAASRLIQERDASGIYQDFFDFVARTSLLGLNRKMLSSLIDAGALDCFHENRSTLKGSIEDALSYAELIRVDQGGMIQINLGLVSKPVMIRMKDVAEEKSENEKNALGFCLGPHPIIAIRKNQNIHLPSLITLRDTPGPADGFALIQSVHQHRTKKGDMMAFVKVADETAELEMAVMPKLFAAVSAELIKGKYCLFHGKIQNDGSCLADSIRFVRQ
jgi:DNA polymerase-3 subunit alpha